MEIFSDLRADRTSQNKLSSSHARNQKIDELRMEYTSDFDTIFVQSETAEVNVSVGEQESGFVEIYFCGETQILGCVSMNAYITSQRILVIKEELCGICDLNRLKMDITLPKKKLQALRIVSKYGDVSVRAGTLLKTLVINNEAGKVDVNATYENANISTRKGNVSLVANAKSETETKIVTLEGHVTARFENVGKLNLFASSRNGNVLKNHIGGMGYDGEAYISSLDGNILIE